MTLYGYAICTLADAKTWIGIDAAVLDYDAIITNLINVVTDWLEKKLHRRVVHRETGGVDDTITEIFSGDGTATYWAQNPPIITLTSIALEDEPAVDVTPSADQVRWDPDTGEVTLLDRAFSQAYPRNCTLVYVGGWTTAPTPIWQLCLIVVKRLYKLRDRQDEDVSSITSSLSGQTIVRLDRLVSRDEWKLVEDFVLERYA